MYRIGVDVGGTFTDLVLVDEDTGAVWATKVLTRYSDLAQGLVDGIAGLLATAGVDPRDVRFVVHGTTLGTNALIERTGARVGLITTAGFIDVLEFGRVQRPAAGMYDFTVDMPDPLVPRRRRLGVPGRVGADGQVVEPLDEAAVSAALQTLRDQGVEALAVSLLFSFLHPGHERRVRELAAAHLPGVPTSLSAEIAPEFREYERTATTVINAYLQPLMARYVQELQERLQERFGLRGLRILRASGGTMLAREAAVQPVHTVNSGPAGGAVAAAYFGRLAGFAHVITADMGGTSFDVGLVVDGQPRITVEGEFDGYPIKTPMVDIHAIGAGGGSISRLEPGGLLQVGPESARSDPGPACYGRGGRRATVTDANLVLGRLNPEGFLGGRMRLDAEAARDALRRDVGEAMGADAVAAAVGVVRVVNAQMVKGIATRILERGYDPRDFALLVYGGAAPLHGAELADQLEIPHVVVPPLPGTFSALGSLLAETRYDLVRTVARPVAQLTAAAVAAELQDLVEQGRVQLAGCGVPPGQMQFSLSADLRYPLQSYEVNTPLGETSGDVFLEEHDLADLVERFHRLHQQAFNYSEPGAQVDLVNLRVVARGRNTLPPLRPVRAAVAGGPLVGSGDTVTAAGGAPPVPAGERRVWFERGGFCSAAVYQRAALAGGARLDGPAVVEELSSTTLVPPGWTLRVDPVGNLILKRNGEVA